MLGRLVPLLFLYGCAHVKYLDGEPADYCLAPEQVGTYEEPRKFHEWCTRHYGREMCAVKVTYKKDINHYSVICRENKRW